MKLSSQQKRIISVSKNIASRSKLYSSALNYLALYEEIPGTLYLKFKTLGSKFFLKFFYANIKYFISIGSRAYFIKKNLNTNNRTYSKLIISWAYEGNFKKNGEYTDKFFNISSRNNKKILWYLIYMDKKLPKKIDDNIILISQKKYFFLNFFIIINYFLNTVFVCKAKPKDILHQMSSFNYFSKIVNKYFLENVKIDKLKKIFITYEGQPFQKELIKLVRKIKKNIKIIGYDHSPPPPLPLNISYDNLSPDLLLVTGNSQVKFYSKYLKWPIKKLKIVPTLRFVFENKRKFSNKIYLPAEIVDENTILHQLSNLIKKNEIGNLNKIKIKNHPNMLNSNIHLRLIINLKKLLKEGIKKKSRGKSKPTAIFIGQTTGVILALEMDVVAYHICPNPIFDSYSESLWPNLKVKQLGTHIFKYEVRKNNTFVNFRKKNKLFQKYYD